MVIIQKISSAAVVQDLQTIEDFIYVFISQHESPWSLDNHPYGGIYFDDHHGLATNHWFVCWSDE